MTFHCFSSTWKVISLVFARLAFCFPPWVLTSDCHFLKLPSLSRAHLIPLCHTILFYFLYIVDHCLNLPCSFLQVHNHNYVSSMRLGILIFLSFYPQFLAQGRHIIYAKWLHKVNVGIILHKYGRKMGWKWKIPFTSSKPFHVYWE